MQQFQTWAIFTWQHIAVYMNRCHYCLTTSWSKWVSNRDLWIKSYLSTGEPNVHYKNRKKNNLYYLVYKAFDKDYVAYQLNGLRVLLQLNWILTLLIHYLTWLDLKISYLVVLIDISKIYFNCITFHPLYHQCPTKVPPASS